MADQRRLTGGTDDRPDVERHLQGCTFPCLRDRLLAHARQTGASDVVLRNLRLLPDTKFTSMGEVLHAYNQVTPGPPVPPPPARNR